MGHLIYQFLINNWQRKTAAIVIATVMWFLVSSEITETRTFLNVPIRVINLPPNKTIPDLLPNGHLKTRATITLTGIKETIASIDPDYLEATLDASNKGDQWIFQISKKNLASTDPDINLANDISHVKHDGFIVNLSRLVNSKIPVNISIPIGESPKGFQFLDIWPQRLYHTVSGPEAEVNELSRKGFDLQFNLGDITLQDLESLLSTEPDQPDIEVHYPVPLEWQKVNISFLGDTKEVLNDPKAKELRINFLKKELLPINRNIPVRVFYPVKNSGKINPKSHKLIENDLIKEQNALMVISIPLYAGNVSRPFLDVVKDNLEITINATDNAFPKELSWNYHFVNQDHLENKYVSLLMSQTRHTLNEENIDPRKKEQQLRERFKGYKRKFRLYKSTSEKLTLTGRISPIGIVVDDSSVSKNH